MDLAIGDMGLVGSTSSKKLSNIAVSAPRNASTQIKIVSLAANIDNEPTIIDERSPAVLKYRTPNFRATANIEMARLDDAETWKVGWIQACTDMLFHNQYGDDGYTSWEFPELTSGRQVMISDCDGRHYPWYGSRNETVIFRGPSKTPQRATITMNDNFHPHVTWRNPANRNQVDPNLTRIIRDQSFYVWLVAWNQTISKSYILTTIKWSMQLDIIVNPKAEVGERACLVSSSIPKQPQILEKNVPIPRCALVPPNANSAQMLVWRPTDGRPVCIIPPVSSSHESDGKCDSKL